MNFVSMKTRRQPERRARQRRLESGGQTKKPKVSSPSMWWGGGRRRRRHPFRALAAVEEVRAVAVPSEGAASAAGRPGNPRALLLRPPVAIVGAASSPLPLTRHRYALKPLCSLQPKEQIQARSMSTASVQSSTAQQPEGPKGQQSDLANMTPHFWLDLETEKLIQFCDEPSMKELYPDRKNEFYARLATKMNDHFGRHEGYVPLDRDKIKEKLRRLGTGWRKQLLEVEKGERQGFLPNIFDMCDTIFSSLFSAGEGTSSGSVRPKRKRCPTPRDKESSIQYLAYHGFKRIELYKYVKALKDEAVLSTFVALNEHTERMDYLQACADRLVKLP